MTRSGENVSAAQSAEQGRQEPQLLVAGGGCTHPRWSSAENAVLPGRVEQFGAGALAENDRGFQRAGGGAATEAVSIAGGTAGGRSTGGACSAEQSAAGAHAAVRNLLARSGALEAPGVGSFLRRV